MEILRLTMSLCVLAAMMVFPQENADAAETAAGQRFDGSVLLEVSDAQSAGDSLVWEFDLKHPGALTVQIVSSLDDADIDPSIQANLTVETVRMVPAGYVKARISFSSQRYYDQWIQMHQSPEKQAALAWFKDARFGMFIHWAFIPKLPEAGKG